MKPIREASQEEVVSYYIASELMRLVEHADLAPKIDAKAIRALANSGKPEEGALRHMSRALLGEWREHSWLHDQFWGRKMKWSVLLLNTSEIDAMPLGGKPEEFHYPKLDKLVDEIKEEAENHLSVTGIHDAPSILLQKRGPMPLKRIIVINGTYGGRHFDYAIGDGAHRAIFMASSGEHSIEAYSGVPQA